jgi:high-affinity Fe2+/Pb2+ permease
MKKSVKTVSVATNVLLSLILFACVIKARYKPTPVKRFFFFMKAQTSLKCSAFMTEERHNYVSDAEMRRCGAEDEVH